MVRIILRTVALTATLLASSAMLQSTTFASPRTSAATASQSRPADME